MWYSEAGKKLSDEDIVVEKGDGLREDRIIEIEGRGDDPVIEGRVSEDIDKEDLPLAIGRWKKRMGISAAGVLRIKGIMR